MSAGGKEYSLAIRIAGMVDRSFNTSLNSAKKELSGLEKARKRVASLESGFSKLDPGFDRIGKAGMACFSGIAKAAGAAAAAVGAATGVSVNIGMEFESAFAGVKKTVDAMDEEYGRLREDILGRLVTIEGKVALVEQRSPQTVAEYRAKLEARMNEVLSNTQLDPARILTEAAIFADKVAVDEETVRLRSHIGQLREMLSKGGATGRKLDFLIQEFNREANTIGSKCSDIKISGQVVDIKAEIEKIREQVQNIE